MSARIDETREERTRGLIEAGAVAVIRMQDPHRVLRVAEALLEGGVRALEVTMTVPGALGCIEAIARELEEALPGVGSVTDAEMAQRAFDAGARYALSPVYKPEIIEVAHRNGCPAIPGAFTPTEILSAHEHGADLVKVFPADVVGMAFFRAVLAPLPYLRLMPTGGVTLTNAGEWLKSGAVAVGVGGALIDRRAIAADDYGTLTANARQLMESVRSGQREIGAVK